jgi:GMP synthase (glutamine-hydrolysing)
VQLAAVAAGGRCAANPKGREFGVARAITSRDAGRAHPLYAGKPPVFDAWTSHADEVTCCRPARTRLAGNAFSQVQALRVAHGRGEFWALQYHPEYDGHEVAALARLRRGELVAQGRFASDAEVGRFIEQLEALHLDPSRADLVEAQGVSPDLLDPERRVVEVRNWLAHQVRGAARHLAKPQGDAPVRAS